MHLDRDLEKLEDLNLKRWLAADLKVDYLRSMARRSRREERLQEMNPDRPAGIIPGRGGSWPSGAVAVR